MAVGVEPTPRTAEYRSARSCAPVHLPHAANGPLTPRHHRGDGWTRTTDPTECLPCGRASGLLCQLSYIAEAGLTFQKSIGRNRVAIGCSPGEQLNYTPAGFGSQPEKRFLKPVAP